MKEWQKEEIGEECRKVTEETGLPAFDPLEYGADGLMEVIYQTMDRIMHQTEFAL